VRGARSLVQCHHYLRYSSLAEIQVGDGLLLVTQLNLAEKLAENPVAKQLVFNLLGHAASYKLEYAPVFACLDGAPQLKAALDTMGLKYTESNNALATLAQKTPATFIVNATPEVLKTFADNLAAVKKFTAAGGSLILCGVTPEGLADYNTIVGVDHVMRPFTRERVVLPTPRSRLASGLTSADVVLFSPQRIFNWTEGNYVASDVFSHIVDFDEVAPFGKSTFPHYANIVNGFFSSDGWPLIINFHLNADNSPFPVPITFPREYEFTEFTWIGNTFYWPQTKLNLVFDNDRGNMLTFDTAPNNEPHVFAIDPPRKATNITLEIAGWQPVEGKGPLVGIDNIHFKVKRPAAFHDTVKPIISIGGLMEYTMGKGRVVLCNINFKETEEVPENAAKKRRVLAAILHNLKAPFAGGKTLIAGMDLNYTPVDISAKSTQYRNEQGWFGDRNRTFKDFPYGLQRMAGVPFDIYEMATSPVPNALMLRGNGIPGELPESITGVPVNLEADALFLLHAARVDRRLNPNEKREGKLFELAKYVVRYVDGETVEIPVMSERDVDHYAQQTPAVLPGAQIAWVKKFDANDDTAVAYMMQWSNPRPGVAIATLDLLPGKDNAGVPVLLALTAAKAE
jgi:beta-galactosidase